LAGVHQYAPTAHQSCRKRKDIHRCLSKMESIRIRSLSQTRDIGRGQPHSVDLIEQYYGRRGGSDIPPTLDRILQLPEQLISLISLKYMIGDLDSLQKENEPQLKSMTA